MNIEPIDLNLLPVLHALLLEKNATRAAKRLHVTQSAVSNALSRLRHALADPLLVRSARGLTPTPRALELQPQLEAVVRSLRGLLETSSDFEPETTTREFTLASADYCTAILGARLAALLSERAPQSRLRFLPLEQLGDGLSTSIDVHLGMPPSVPAGCHSRVLFEDSFVCLVRRDRGVARRIKLADYLRARHVRVSVLGSTEDPVDRALAKRGKARNVALTLTHFSAIPQVVERSDLVATMSRRLAQVQARHHQVVLCEPPLALGQRATRMLWHERTQADPGARFFRDLIVEALAAEIGRLQLE